MALDESAQSWVGAACGAAVLSSVPIAGGASSTIDVVKLADGRSVILRRVPPLEHVPNHRPAEEIRNEAAALGLLEGIEWAPHLIAADADGTHFGVAASIQTVIPGRVDVLSESNWIAVLVEAVHVVADLAVCADALPAFDPWIDPSGQVPTWTTAPAKWHRAIELVGDWRPQGTHWAPARTGPMEADLSRCRVELEVIAGRSAADQLLHGCADVVPEFDYRWDLLVALELAASSRSLLGFNNVGAKLDLPTIHVRLDQIVANALRLLD